MSTEASARDTVAAAPAGWVEAEGSLVQVDWLRVLQSILEHLAGTEDGQDFLACLRQELSTLVGDAPGSLSDDGFSLLARFAPAAGPATGRTEEVIEGLWAQTLAALIQSQELLAELESARAEIRQMHEAFQSNRDIGVAVGILMFEGLCSREAAFARLSRVSQHRNIKLRDVATRVIETGCLE